MGEKFIFQIAGHRLLLNVLFDVAIDTSPFHRVYNLYVLHEF